MVSTNIFVYVERLISFVALSERYRFESVKLTDRFNLMERLDNEAVSVFENKNNSMYDVKEVESLKI